MRISVIGLERSEGVSQKSGTPKPYAIGRVHAAVKVEAMASDKRMAKGAMGTSYDVDVEVIKRLEHLPMPFEAELTAEDVMRFGKRETKVLDVVPVSLQRPVQSLSKAA